MLGSLYRPALTTVHQDVKNKGVVAAQTLFKLIKGEKTDHQITLPVRLVVRDTVTKPRKSSFYGFR